MDGVHLYFFIHSSNICLTVHLSLPIHPSLLTYIFIYHLSVLYVFISLRIIYTWILYKYNKVLLNLLEEELHWSSWVVLLNQQLLHGLLNWNNLIYLIKIDRLTASTFQMVATIVKIWALEYPVYQNQRRMKKYVTILLTYEGTISSVSSVAQSCLTVTPWTAACQASLIFFSI